MGINQIYEDFVRGVESKEITCSVFLDLKKAFDTVDHNILIKKLNCYGVRGLPLKFLSSYLTNRQQYTVVHQAESSVKSVSCGVPQGSTLGPLLFLIYINDLPNACNLRIRLFADDASLTMSNKSKTLLENHMNNELIKVDEWLKTNKLSLNYDKTEILVVNKSKSRGGSLNIRIGKNDIAQVKHVKYLGVIIDEDLSWKPHIHNQCSKIAHGNWALTNLRKYVNLSTLKCAYYGLIYPHLQHCSSLWGQASKTSLKPVQTLQNKALKIMINTRWHHSASPLYQTLQLLKFDDIVKLQLAKIMHSVHNNNISNLYFGFFKVEKFHHYCTRTSINSNLVQTSARTEKGKSTISFSGPKIWR